MNLLNSDKILVAEDFFNHKYDKDLKQTLIESIIPEFDPAIRPFYVANIDHIMYIIDDIVADRFNIVKAGSFVKAVNENNCIYAVAVADRVNRIALPIYFKFIGYFILSGKIRPKENTKTSEKEKP